MNTRFLIPILLKPLARTGALLVLCWLVFAPATLAQTAGGTVISNRAAATYSDGTNNYSTVSNTVTVTVANVSGLAITPDGGSVPTVVSGQNGVDFTFTVTNTSNFATQVRFLASGASVQLSGTATVQAAVIDTDNNGIDVGDTDINGNAADVLSAALAQNASLTVIVRVNVGAGAIAGSTINVSLGDASTGGPTFDNQTADSSANEVRTSSGVSAPVNGESEARGDVSATVENDAQVALTLNAPAGPVALGSNITYVYTILNGGQRDAEAQTLAGAPAGSDTGVFVMAPIPIDTTFVSITPPAGVTVLYTTSSLANDPLSILTTWTTVQPAASSITRVAFNVGPTLAVGASVTNLQLVVQVKLTANAANPIYAIGGSHALNSLSLPVADQSGDAVPNKGDGNTNFDEPRLGVDPPSATQGFQQPTTLQAVGSVLIGPSGQPGAVGPTTNNDDYSNRSVSAGIAGVAFGGVTTASGTVDFINTVSNTGNANDVMTLSTPTTAPGFTVAISTDGGATFTTVSGGGTVTLAIALGGQANITVRITAPAGNLVLTGFDTTIRARSGNTPASTNETIDRLYTGFLRVDKTATVTNATGVGGPTDAVPGAVIEYTITYLNISSSGGTNNLTLTASSIVITEDGNAAPNNWGATTSQVVGSASDTNGGTLTGDSAGSSVLTDSVASLAPGQSGTFKFRRTIN